MSKSKMKKRVSSAGKKQNSPQEKKKWTKMKDFNYLPPIKWLPGFRTAKHWKRIVAIIYLTLTPFSLILHFGEFRYFGVFIFIALLTLPFIICSMMTFMEKKDPYYMKETLISAFIFGCDNIALVICLNNFMKTLPPV